MNSLSIYSWPGPPNQPIPYLNYAWPRPAQRSIRYLIGLLPGPEPGPAHEYSLTGILINPLVAGNMNGMSMNLTAHEYELTCI